MTIDVEKDLADVFKDEGASPPGAPDAPERPASGAGPASGDGGRQGDDGGSGGGGHTRMARWAEKYDVRNSWQVIAGAILIPLGVVLILLGWYGAAHARVVQQQIPYMVSGSFIGLGCMIVGGLLFFGHWLYRIYDQADLQHEETQRVLETIAAALLAQRGDGSGVTGEPAPVAATGEPASTTFYATAAGTVYHRADCAVIAHHPDDLRVLGSDGVVGLRPCQICAPGPS
jgi:hypothetical protein